MSYPMFICTSMYMYIQKVYVNNVGNERREESRKESPKTRL